MSVAHGGSSDRRFIDRRPETPRRVRNGIKLQGKTEPAAETPLAQRWLKLLEGRIEPLRLAAGLEYARSGQVVNLDVIPGAVTASVQGTQAKPYQTKLWFRPLSAEQWDRLIDAMASEAIYVAKLLANELPPTIDDLLAMHQLALLPAASQELNVECSCRDSEPCKHAAAVGYILAERLAAEPLLVFSMLGMPTQQLLDRLRQVRTLQTQGMAAAHVEAVMPESDAAAPPLDACIDDFWRPGPELAEFESLPTSQHVPHALLRRLGPSPLSGRFPMAGLLASVYDTVAAEAERLRDQAIAAADDPSTTTADSNGNTTQQ